MSQTTLNTTTSGPASGDVLALPAAVRERANGQLEGQTIVAWSRYDVDDDNRYAERFAVLTESLLILLEGAGASRSIPIGSISEIKTVEGLGVNQARVIVDDRLEAELRYSKKYQRSMQRLVRKLERRLPKKEGRETPPEWLEAVERQEELKEHCPKCGHTIPAYAEGVCPKCLHKRSILWRLMDTAKPYRKRIWVALVLTMVVSALTTVPPIFLRNMVNSAIDLEGSAGLSVAQRVKNLVFWSVATLFMSLVMEILGGYRVQILAKMGSNVAADLRHKVYAHMHTLSLRYFARRRTGSLITRVTNDTDRLWDFIVFGSVDLIRDVVMIVAIAFVMFYFNWKLAIVALIPLPPLAIITYYRSMKMQWMFGRLWTYWSRLTAVVGDALPGIRVVKAFGNEDREIARFDARSDAYTAKEHEVNAVWIKLRPVISITMRVGTLLVWTVGGYLVVKYPGEQNNLGTLVMFTAFLQQFYQPIMELANSNRMLTRAATSAQRVFEVLDTAPEIYSRADSVRKDHFNGKIEFKQVSFSYEGTQPALRDVSLLIQPGEMIGLCGTSGAGKSTFVNLICRFYDVTDGQILIDDLDVREYDVRWLRRQVGVVLQEPYLFHGTIADNIRYGNPDASQLEIIEAARAANAHDFIVGFPDGYDTMVGERGQSLSGGERQRISIARAILHNPKILILDEATSSVDTETEKQIQQALDRLVEGRTTIAIAHRLSTLQAADRLVVLEKGKIIEQGTHAELVDKAGGAYAKLHKTQEEMNSVVAIR